MFLLSFCFEFKWTFNLLNKKITPKICFEFENKTVCSEMDGDEEKKVRYDDLTSRISLL